MRGADRSGAKPPDFGFPLVVKPDREGSTVGITIVRGPDQWEAALAEAAKHDSRILAEGFIPGREITVGIPEREGPPRDRDRPEVRLLRLPVQVHRGPDGVRDPGADGPGHPPPRRGSTRGAPPGRWGCGGPRGSTIASTRRERLLPRGEHDPGDDRDEPPPKAAKFDGLSFDDLVAAILSDAGLGK